MHSGYEVDPLWEIEEPGEPLMVTIRTRTNDDDRNFALGRVRELWQDVDVLCVSIHWGYGGSDELRSTSARSATTSSTPAQTS